MHGMLPSLVDGFTAASRDLNWRAARRWTCRSASRSLDRTGARHFPDADAWRPRRFDRQRIRSNEDGNASILNPSRRGIQIDASRHSGDSLPLSFHGLFSKIADAEVSPHRLRAGDDGWMTTEK
jgi:hypothetical protein